MCYNDFHSTDNDFFNDFHSADNDFNGLDFTDNDFFDSGLEPKWLRFARTSTGSTKKRHSTPMACRRLLLVQA